MSKSFFSAFDDTTASMNPAESLSDLSLPDVVTATYTPSQSPNAHPISYDSNISFLGSSTDPGRKRKATEEMRSKENTTAWAFLEQ